MSGTKPLQIVYGAGIWGAKGADSVRVGTVDEAQALLDVLRKHGVTMIDTSRNYPRGKPGTSELLIGETDAPQWAIFDTKVFSAPGDHQASKIAESVSGSLEALKISKIHIEYLHWPDRTTPLQETLQAMDEAYRQGKFEKFGISNYSVDEVRQILSICETKGYVKPCVYQGHYNALARRGEKQLLPVLRENNIAFYAYMPAAGGAFSATSSRMTSQNTVGALMRNWYGSETTSKAIQVVVQVAEKHHMTGHELSLRWILHHSALDASYGDGIIIGSSRPSQLEETLAACSRGPLPEELVVMMDEVWVSAEAGAPSYSPWVDIDGKHIEIKI